MKYAITETIPNELFIVEKRYSLTVWLRNIRTNRLHRGMNPVYVTYVQDEKSIQPYKRACEVLRNNRQRIRKDMPFNRAEQRQKNLASNKSTKVSVTVGSCRYCSKETMYTAVIDDIRAYWCGC